MSGQPAAAGIELSSIFGSLHNDRDRHRAAERISKLNQSARPYGVRLEIDKASGQLLIRHRAPQQLRRFQAKLAQGAGAIQRAIAQALAGKIAADPSCQADRLAEFANLQLQELPAWVSKPLQSALGLSLDALFIDASYSLRSAQGERGPTRPGACAFLRAALTGPQAFHGFLLGGPGSGKTSALYSLFQELSRLYLAGQIQELPILIPAAYAEILQGRLCWRLGQIEPYLRQHPQTEDSLRLLESAGRTILLIDAIDENPGLVDCSRTEVVKAWQTILRNRCVVSCRSRFFIQHLQGGDLEGKLGGAWSILSLADWSPAQAQTLYRRLAGCSFAPPREARVSAAEIKRTFAHLGRLSEGKIAAGTASFRATPLNLWLDSLFVASNRALLPRNEYELLEFAIKAISRWQAAKKGRVTPLDAMLGLLGRMAWQSYGASRDRERRHTRYGDLPAILAEQWPSLASRTADVIIELENHPVIRCDLANGLLRIDSHFCDFLAARHVIQTLLAGDSRGAVKHFSQPLLWDVSRFLDEGIDILEEPQRDQLAQCLIAAFRTCEADFAARGSFATAWTLNQLGYHLGRMGHPRSREFLHGVLRQKSPALRSDMCYWAIVIGLALSGDDSAVSAYVEQLERQPQRYRVNMGFLQIYFLDQHAEGADLEAALKRPIRSWDKCCDAKLAQLSSKTFTSIRLLDLFGLRRFIEELGPGPFQSSAGPARVQALKSILAQLSPQCAADRKLARQCDRLRATLRRHRIAA